MATVREQKKHKSKKGEWDDYRSPAPRKQIRTPIAFAVHVTVFALKDVKSDESIDPQISAIDREYKQFLTQCGLSTPTRLRLFTDEDHQERMFKCQPYPTLKGKNRTFGCGVSTSCPWCHARTAGALCSNAMALIESKEFADKYLVLITETVAIDASAATTPLEYRKHLSDALKAESARRAELCGRGKAIASLGYVDVIPRKLIQVSIPDEKDPNGPPILATQAEWQTVIRLLQIHDAPVPGARCYKISEKTHKDLAHLVASVFKLSRELTQLTATYRENREVAKRESCIKTVLDYGRFRTYRKERRNGEHGHDGRDAAAGATAPETDTGATSGVLEEASLSIACDW